MLRLPPLLLLPLLMSVVTLPSKVVSKVLSRQREMRVQITLIICDINVNKSAATSPLTKKQDCLRMYLNVDLNVYLSFHSYSTDKKKFLQLS